MLFAGARSCRGCSCCIARTRSRELFLLVVLASAGHRPLAAQHVRRLARAGRVPGRRGRRESPLSHQVGADVLPFREAFAVLFFVSVGMLVDPRLSRGQRGQVLALTALIVAGQGFARAVLLGLSPPARCARAWSSRGTRPDRRVLVHRRAGGRGSACFARDQYSLILAGALFSITVNPLLFRPVRPVERMSSVRLPNISCAQAGAEDAVPLRRPRRRCRLRPRRRTHRGRAREPRRAAARGGGGRRQGRELQAPGVPVLFGDAANSEILDHAGLDRARALVVTLPDEAAASLVVAGARQHRTRAAHRRPRRPPAAAWSTYRTGRTT